MSSQSADSGREITDYFNSPAWHTPKTTELLATLVTELAQTGKPVTRKALVASVIYRLELEKDQAILQGYRNVLSQLMKD